jgi:putative two-component system response regulator
MLNDKHLNARILIVDDQDTNLRLLKSILKRANYTSTMSISDPREMLEAFSMFQPDLILLDLMMPHLDGFAVMELLRPLIAPEDFLPILVLTADATATVKHKALSMGADDFLTKPLDTAEVLLRVHNLLRTRFLHLRLGDRNRILEDAVAERTSELREVHSEILERLAMAAEYRDDDTGQHVLRVSNTTVLLAQTLGVPDRDLELIRRAAQLHDVGKIGIPDHILLKPGKLAPAEFEVMKSHTTIGARILSGGRSDLIRMASSIAYTHHERWDGQGYPRQLSGDGIPHEGRIVAVADVYDALTNSRPYKPAWPVEEAVAEIKRQSGAQFDPTVVEAFFELHRQALLPLSCSPVATALQGSTRVTTRLLSGRSALALR